jgi:hypothetical protein
MEYAQKEITLNKYYFYYYRVFMKSKPMIRMINYFSAGNNFHLGIVNGHKTC